MNGSSPIRTRAMMHEHQLSHLPASVDDMYSKIAALPPKRYAGITHDRDQIDVGRPVAAHLHVMMEFANSRSIRSIAKAPGDKPERIEAWKARVENGFSYLAIRLTARDRSISTTRASFAPTSIIPPCSPPSNSV